MPLYESEDYIPEQSTDESVGSTPPGPGFPEAVGDGSSNDHVRRDLGGQLIY
jgi:hypothetical protein